MNSAPQVEKHFKLSGENITHQELKDFNNHLDKEIQEYDKDKKAAYIERKKIEIYYRTFNSYQILNTSLVKIASNNLKYKFNYINFGVLKVKDKKVQFYIMIVFLLYILYMIPKLLAAVRI